MRREDVKFFVIMLVVVGLSIGTVCVTSELFPKVMVTLVPAVLFGLVLLEIGNQIQKPERDKTIFNMIGGWSYIGVFFFLWLISLINLDFQLSGPHTWKNLISATSSEAQSFGIILLVVAFCGLAAAIILTGEAVTYRVRKFALRWVAKRDLLPNEKIAKIYIIQLFPGVIVGQVWREDARKLKRIVSYLWFPGRLKLIYVPGAVSSAVLIYACVKWGQTVSDQIRQYDARLKDFADLTHEAQMPNFYKITAA